MINTHDLMLGNWYYDAKYNANTQVTSYLLLQPIFNTCDGISVTTKILKKIGFEEYEDSPLEGNFFRYWDKDCKYKLDVRNFWTNSRREWYVHIDNDVCNTIGSGEFNYVHELQNLVRVITRYDLPIIKEMLDE